MKTTDIPARFTLACLPFALFSFVAFGCGGAPDASQGDWSVQEGGGGETSYDEDSTVVAQAGDEESTYVVKGDGEGCVELDGDCVDVEEARKQADDPHCDDPDARVDLVVEDGEVVDVVCYPPKSDGTDVEEVETDSEGNAEVPQSENGKVVTFGDETDGEPIDQDITVDAERSTLWGNGVGNTIIDGNITVESNESRVRSLTVKGNVTYRQAANNSALSFCKIEGDLAVDSNEFSAMNCEVFGDVDVSGRNARLMNIGVQGEWNVHSSAECKGCYSFSDDNDDFTVQEDEEGDELTCDDGGGGESGEGGPPEMGTGGN